MQKAAKSPQQKKQKKVQQKKVVKQTKRTSTFLKSTKPEGPTLVKLDILRSLRRNNQYIATPGVRDNLLSKFSDNKSLGHALDDAFKAMPFIPQARNTEKARITDAQQGIVQFYDPTTVNQYIPIGGRGPWIVTDAGAVIYDAGGYGMLGFGHAPQFVLDVMSRPHVQANIMTPSFAQKRFVRAMQNEIGNTRAGKKCPYDDFVAINSGSESVSFAMRVADADAKVKTGPGGPAEGKKTCLVSLSTSFHGRTERPAAASDSSRKSYLKHLKSYEDIQVPLFTSPVNDIEALEQMFKDISAQGYHPEMMLMEGTQGEGNPGVKLDRAFYDKARQLTKEHHSLLLIDSIQAGFRATGHLSIVDYPGFQDAEAPDFETFSKALNAGQYPMSAVAFAPGISKIYKQGLYGNTMTGNPRALSVAATVLGAVNPTVKENIVKQGQYMLEQFKEVQKEFPNMVEDVSGSGLLNALHLKPEIKAYGSTTSVEYLARSLGLGVIHGGKNALRYTPHFEITKEEVDLVMDLTRSALSKYASIHNIEK